MLEQADAVIGGTRILLKILGLAKAYLGIERNKPDAIAFLAERCRALKAPVEVVPLKVKYPQGAEKQLIKAILKREVPSGGLPFDVGVVVQNVGTVAAVHDAVARGKPLIDRILTVTGAGVKEPKNLRVRIGTPFADVIAYCGGFAAEEGERKIIMGGPMMGLAQYSLEVPVVKGTSGILVLADGVRAGKETTCIKCGRCVAICPVYLMPNRISDYAEIDKFDQCNEYGVRDCIECGACAYVCDVKRPIVHLVKYAKLNLAKKKQAAPVAAQATQGIAQGGATGMSATTVVSVSPHLRDRDSTARVMWGVCIALVPALAAATYLFGWRALLLTAVVGRRSRSAPRRSASSFSSGKSPCPTAAPRSPGSSSPSPVPRRPRCGSSRSAPSSRSSS